MLYLIVSALNWHIQLDFLVLTGMFIWSLIDCKSGKCALVVDPVKDKRSKGLISCLSCIALDASESWLVSIQVQFFHVLFGFIRDPSINYSVLLDH